MFKNILYNLFVRGGIFICSFLNSIIVARYLGPEGRGQIVLILTLLTLIFYVGQIGLSSGITFISAKGKYHYGAMFVFVVVSSIILGIISAFVFFVINYFNLVDINLNFLYPKVFYLFLITLPIYFFYSLFNSLELGYMRYNVFYFLSLSVPIYNLVSYLILFVVLKVKDINTIITINLIIFWLVLIFFLIKNFDLKNLNIKIFNDFELYRYSFKSYLTLLLSTYTLRIDIIVISLLFDPKVLGVYSIALLFKEIIYSITDAVAVIIFPQLVKEIKSSHEITSFYLRVLSFVLIILLIAINLISKYLIIYIYGVEFAEAIKYLLLLTPGIYFLSLEVILARQNASKGFPLLISFAWAATFIIAYFGSLYAGKLYDKFSIPIIISFSYFFIYGTMLIYFIRTNNLKLSECIFIKKSDFVFIKSLLLLKLNKFFGTS